MDLSQQELPLTSYFAKGSKDYKSRPAARNEGKQTEQSLKRKRIDVQYSSPAPPPRLRKAALQLPTPVPSVRKRIHNGKHNSVLSSEEAQSSCDVQEDVFGTTPSTRRQRTVIQSGIATPQTSSRQSLQLRNPADHSPLAPSNRPLASKPGAFAPSHLASISSRKTVNGQLSSDSPTFPVPSSQSQYLLHLDMTPKRKRSSQRIEHVISSQTQEEMELTLASPLEHAPVAHLLTPGKNAQTPLPSRARKKSQHANNLDLFPVALPIHTPAGPSRSPLKEATDDLLSKFLSPTRQRIMTPSRKTRTPQGFIRHDSIENIPPVHVDDSMTESESDTDTLQGHPPARDGPMRCGTTHGDFPGEEDDSATEAESDTDILDCVAAIGKKQSCERRCKVLSGDAPPPPVISPLVSPVRSRTAAMPQIMGSTQFSPQDATGSSVSESLPSVVRDFIRMFPGDDSYPADFPESLRI